MDVKRRTTFLGIENKFGRNGCVNFSRRSRYAIRRIQCKLTKKYRRLSLPIRFADCNSCLGFVSQSLLNRNENKTLRISNSPRLDLQHLTSLKHPPRPQTSFQLKFRSIRKTFSREENKRIISYERQTKARMG